MPLALISLQHHLHQLSCLLLCKVRRGGSLSCRVPLEIRSTQNQTLAVLIKSLDKAGLHCLLIRTQRPVEADADVAGASL